MSEETNLSRRLFLGRAAMAIALAQMGTLASARTEWDAGSKEARCPLSPVQRCG
jgi:hypothetical protein